MATQIALVLINLARVFTIPIRFAAERLDGFITSLAERSEEGIRPAEAPRVGWTRIIAAVFWGIAAVALRIGSIVTVFTRQLAVTVDDFFRALAEREVGA
ncbi:MAG: hypothetical protein HYU30_04095 [Chloroflexi bacterium]|nr:hypothetical protein [Chloroflexota bacterium]